MAQVSAVIETDIPARLDRLPWTRFHLLLVTALGITWILDGLEVTIVGAIGPVLQNPKALGISSTELGAVSSFYVVGAVVGALFWGWLTDRQGRKRVFYATLLTYLVGVLLSALAWNFWSFILFRVLTGFGIGGEYAAVNSAIDELIPARYRGRVDLIVNGSFWIGAAVGAAVSLVILDPRFLPAGIGWRFIFGVGGILGFFILFLRRMIPESPRWLVIHGRAQEAETTVRAVEDEVAAITGKKLPPATGRLKVHPRLTFGLGVIFKAMLGTHRDRAILSIVLMIAQAFLFNAVFSTYGVVLTHFYGVSDHGVGVYLLPLAASNFLGPLLLGALFDTVGRRKMITGTFALSAILLLLTAVLFALNRFSAMTQTAAWMAIFFFASAAASSVYLTVSEIFPLETRALAIAVFYAVGTAIGGSLSPLLFGWLIQSGSNVMVSGGYALAGLLLVIAAVTEWKMGLDAEGQSLESIAHPLSTASGLAEDHPSS